jgi:putative tryptophan/tyrosine transport system substrate-binding protein
LALWNKLAQHTKAARAQQSEQMRRIGVLVSLAADDPGGQARVAALQQSLQ